MEISSGVEPPEIEKLSQEAALSLLPEKSKVLYLNTYQTFKKWKQEQKATSSSEVVLLAYFGELSKKYKPSTLWTVYSMLKGTISLNENIQIEAYSKLLFFLKRQAEGFEPKQSKTFSSENIYRFVTEADDFRYLPTKVASIFGVMGACRSEEMYNMKISDIQDLGVALVVNVANRKTKHIKKFMVTDEYYAVCKKYLSGRSAGSNINVFQQYRGGKVTKQRIGINAFIHMGKVIANFLELENPEQYTGHSFRKSSAQITGSLHDARWKSTAVVEPQSVQNKENTANKIDGTITNHAELTQSTQNQSTSTHKILILDNNGHLTDVGESGINETVASNLVKAWLAKLMQLKPAQQSQAISIINNALSLSQNSTEMPVSNNALSLNQNTSSTVHQSSTEIPTSGVYPPLLYRCSKVSQIPKEFVSVSNCQAPIDVLCEKSSKYPDPLDLDNVEMKIEVEPTSIIEHPSPENRFINNGFQQAANTSIVTSNTGVSESETSNTQKTKRFRGMLPKSEYSNVSGINVEPPFDISDQLAQDALENLELMIKVEPTENTR